MTAAWPWSPTGSSSPASATSTPAWPGCGRRDGPLVIETRLAGGRPVLGVCVGMQVLFDGSDEPTASPQEGLGEWPGTVERLPCRGRARTWGGARSSPPPTAGCSPASSPSASTSCTRMPCRTGPSSRPPGPFAAVAPRVTWADHGGRFVAAVENGPLSATQFHPEKSGDAGLALLENWVRAL